MTFPQLARCTGLALLLLRVVGVIFMSGGWKHLQDPQARNQPRWA
jgi:hypothetical protein